MQKVLLCALGLVLGTAAGAATAPPPSVAQIASAYQNFDIDGDGIREINALSLMDFEPATPLGGSQGLAIVLVDPRLLASSSGELNATVRNHLIVSNESSIKAEGLTFSVEPIDGTEFHFDAVEAPFDLNGHSQMSWLLIPGGGWGNAGNNVLVQAEWREGDQVKNGSWSVALGG